MEDFSHVGYHRGDWFKWFGIAAICLVLVAGAIALFSRIGMTDGAGNTTLPPDWPQLGYTVDDDATDLHFDPDIRTLGGAVLKVGQKTSKSADMRNSEPVAWQIHFNHPDPPEQLLKATDQTLQSAGWKAKGGRTMEHFAQTGLLDLSWHDPSGEYVLMLRYWDKPPLKYGNAAQPQHWHVMIRRERY